jgi:hypothetical protein
MDSGDKFLWHGGDSRAKKEGERERRQWGAWGRRCGSGFGL